MNKIKLFIYSMVSLPFFLFFRKVVMKPLKWVLFTIYKWISWSAVKLNQIQIAISLWIKAVKICSVKWNSIFFRFHHDEMLEKIFLKIEMKIQLGHQKQRENILIEEDRNNILYIVSNMSEYGGHTRVLEEFISAHAKDQYSVYLYSTEIYQTQNSRFLENIKKNTTETYLSQLPYKNYNEKIKELTDYCLRHSIKTIVLFQHVQDILALISVYKLKKESNIKVIYYHHQDLAITIAPDFFDTYIDVSTYTQKISIQRYKNVKLIPIPINRQLYTIKSLHKKKTKKILTAAHPRKLFYNDSTFFLDLIVKILEEIKELHYVIITSDTPEINMMKKYFNKRKVLDRVEFKYNISDLNLIYDEYDIYLDSNPVRGGKTILEMMCKDKPCLIYNGKENIFHIDQNVEFIARKTVEELIQEIKTLLYNTQYYQEYVERMNQFVESYHDIDIVIKQIEKLT